MSATAAPAGPETPEAPAAAAPGRGTFHPLEIAEVERLCDDAVAVTFAVPDDLAARFAFRAGQNVTVRRWVDGVEHRRTYSVCAPEGGPLRVGVRKVPGGLFSSWLVDDARPGDVVEVQPPTGRFTPDPSGGGHHVLVGAGSGVTPLLSIAATLLRESAEARVTFVYGNRRTDTTMFLEDLADLKNLHPTRLEVIHVLSREPRDVKLFSGRLDGGRLETILRALVPWQDSAGFWMCGPFAMVEELRATLVGMGVPTGRVHVELFHVDAPPPPVVHDDAVAATDVCSVTFTLDGRTTATTSPRAASLLEAAQSSRPDVPFACRGGVCGTCRARVVSGQVEMRRNYALEPHEVDAGFVLTCQAHPVDDEVTVDFDA